MARDKKLARQKQAWIVFEDESGASLTPVVRRAWAPRGKTPVLHHPFNWKRISMAAALAYRWDGARTRLYFQTQDGTYNEESLIEFIRELRRHFRGRAGDPALGRSALASEPNDDAVPGRAAALAGGEAAARLRPRAGPAEGLWSNLKSQELANRWETHVQMVTIAARQGANRVRTQRGLLLGFLRHTGLQL